MEKQNFDLASIPNGHDPATYKLVQPLGERYILNSGIIFTSLDVFRAVEKTNKKVLEILSHPILTGINLGGMLDDKLISGIVGEIFSVYFSNEIPSEVMRNIVSAGYPDLVKKTQECTAAESSNERDHRCWKGGDGIEVKSKMVRSKISWNQDFSEGLSVTWSSHHQQTDCLMGLVVAYINKSDPQIISAFISDSITPEDWTEPNNTTEGSMNTNVCSLRASGVQKMGRFPLIKPVDDKVHYQLKQAMGEFVYQTNKPSRRRTKDEWRKLHDRRKEDLAALLDIEISSGLNDFIIKNTDKKPKVMLKTFLMESITCLIGGDEDTSRDILSRIPKVEPVEYPSHNVNQEILSLIFNSLLIERSWETDLESLVQGLEKEIVELKKNDAIS
jgi:hypothetical protein